MRAHIASAGLVLGALLGLSGCSLTLDPEGVPSPQPAACVSTGCSSVACGGVDNCNNACGPGSGCTVTHAVQGRFGPGAGSTAAPGGHAVARGTLAGSTAEAAAPSGHSISQGNLSP